MTNKLAFFQTDRKIVVGIFSHDQLFWKIEDITSSTQNEKLLSTIQNVLENSKIKKIEAIITTRGPGSFTSIRILLSAAMGLSLGYQCPCYLPTVFDLLGYEQQPPFYMTIDSKRGTHFTLLVENKPDIEQIKEFNAVDLAFLRKEHAALNEIFIDNHSDEENYYLGLLKKLYQLSLNDHFISKDFSPLYVSPLTYKKVHEQSSN